MKYCRNCVREIDRNNISLNGRCPYCKKDLIERYENGTGENVKFPLQNEIDRLVNLMENKDYGFLQLALYSFIEAYIKYNEEDLQVDTFFSPYYRQEIKYRNSFPDLVKEYATRKNREDKVYTNLSHFIIDSNGSHTETNGVRHYFKNVNKNSVQTAFYLFQEFFDLENLLNLDMEKLDGKFREIFKESENEFRTSNNFQSSPMQDILKDSKDDLFEKYLELVDIWKADEKELKKLQRNEKVLEENVKNKNWTPLKEIYKIRETIINNQNSLKEREERLSEYSQIISTLAYFTIQARTRHDYERRIIKPTDKQREILDIRITNLQNNEGKSLLIRGGPGTGKTLVLIGALARLFGEAHLKDLSSYRYVLLTYYASLNKYIDYLFKVYNKAKFYTNGPINDHNIGYLRENIKTYDEYISEKLKLVFNEEYKIQNETVRILKRRCNRIFSVNFNIQYENSAKDPFKTLSPDNHEALYKTATEVIWPNLLTKNQYLYGRYERGATISIWDKIQEIQKYIIENCEEIQDSFAYYLFWMITRDIKKNEDKDKEDYLEQLNTNGICKLDDLHLNSSYRPLYILIDEVQDLTNAQIYTARKLTAREGGCILAGDMNQSIRKRNYSWKELLGMDLRGNSVHLSSNYRSSEEIQKLGEEYKKTFPAYSTREERIEGDDELKAFIPGAKPQLFITRDSSIQDNYKDTFKQIKTAVKMCCDKEYGLGISQENICVVAFNKDSLRNLCEKRTVNGVEVLSIDDKPAGFVDDEKYKFEEDAKKYIRLCTVQSIKGIDCSVLLFMITDSEISDSSLWFNYIYTSITRSMDLLFIFVPEFCKTKNLGIANLVYLMKPNELEVKSFIKNCKLYKGKVIDRNSYQLKIDAGEYTDKFKYLHVPKVRNNDDLFETAEIGDEFMYRVESIDDKNPNGKPIKRDIAILMEKIICRRC